LCIVVLIALNVLANQILPHAQVLVSLGSLPIWLLIAARRLRAFGASVLWGLLPFAAGFLIGFARGFFRATLHQDLMSNEQSSLLIGLVTIVTTLVLGVWPSRRGLVGDGERLTPRTAQEDGVARS
jgi:hypothetical protein